MDRTNKPKIALRGIRCCTALVLIFLINSNCKNIEEIPQDENKLAKFFKTHWVDMPQALNVKNNSSLSKATISPSTCKACHNKQHSKWSLSRHALAMGAGVEIQIKNDPSSINTCLKCHAPLLEQQPNINGFPNPHFIQELSKSAVSCPSCHIRDGQVIGPPPSDPTAIERSKTQSTHGAFQISSGYEDSRFCAKCHQFSLGQTKVAGLFLENTYNEWKESSFPKKGISCQKCHMPNREHSFRGIHDPKMTASGLKATLEVKSGDKFIYRVRSLKIGHFFPTYVTPKVSLIIRALDSNGNIIAEAITIIQRKIDIFLKQEFDTRIPPNGTAQVSLNQMQVTKKVKQIIAFTKVEPDEFYERFFKAYNSDPILNLKWLHKKALSETQRSAYKILRRNASL